MVREEVREIERRGPPLQPLMLVQERQCKFGTSVGT